MQFSGEFNVQINQDYSPIKPTHIVGEHILKKHKNDVRRDVLWRRFVRITRNLFLALAKSANTGPVPEL